MLKLSGLTIRREFPLRGTHQYLAALAGLVRQQSPQTGPLLGAVDLITRDRVAGWAFHPNDPGAPVLVEILNGDEPLVRIVANEPRQDVAAAGYGYGNNGFDVRLPPDVYRSRMPRIHVRRASDRAPIRLHQYAKIELLASEGRKGSEALISPTHPDFDLLASPITHIFLLELTSRCNLRCVYCAVSQPLYQGVDMDIVDFDSLVQQLKARRVRMVGVNGHGETTMIRDWDQMVMRLADEGLCISIITNFARLLRLEELEAMARISEIMISVDTHRPELQ